MDIFNNAQRAWLLLEDGTIYEGYGLGCSEDAIGELVFNTGVVGFQEILTDPANANNIIVETFPLVGNYGVTSENDLHDSITARGWVVREWCAQPSNFRSEGRIDEFLERKKISAIFDLDTRAITRKLRDEGVQRGLITRKNPAGHEQELMEQIKSWKAPASAWVNYDEKINYDKLDAKYSITMLNYGIRNDVVKALMERGCRITIVPASCTAQQVLDTNPDAIVLCGGAGLEAFEQNPAWKETVAELMKSDKPVMGIDLGHQVMALAMGGSVEKMHCGHRGANCPVTETASGRTFITSQNHGYTVKEIPSCAAVSHLNINDKSCEGLEYPQMKAMSVQFIPEAEIGQKNFDGIYERFLGLIG